MKSKFIEDYFREKYQLQDLSEEDLYKEINRLDATWKVFEDELTLNENKSN